MDPWTAYGPMDLWTHALMIKPSGSAGWDDYADFYDWENAQTMARRDVPFWQRLALAAEGPVLELGCGTGRVTLPLARAGVKVVGVDLSAPMLKRARDRVRRTPLGRRARLVRADIRALPFPPNRFPLVAAPYGILQSLLREADLAATLRAVHDVLTPGGRLVIELVADLRDLAGVPRRDPAAWLASRPQGPSDARGIRPPGPPQGAHAVRTGVRRATRK